MNMQTYITFITTADIEAETEKRAALAKLLTSGKAIDALDFESVMTAAAEAKPWRRVLRIAENKTVAEAIAAVRELATEELLERSEGQSTSALRNEENRLEREGLRRFLGRTAGLVERITEMERAEQDAAEQPTAEAKTAEQPTAEAKTAEQPTAEAKTAEQPIAEQQPARKPSPAQAAMLALIAGGCVQFRSQGYSARSATRAYGPNGAVNTRVVETCISYGWAARDSSTSLYQGQEVALTDAGCAALPAA